MNIKRILAYFMAFSFFLTGTTFRAENVFAKDSENMIINTEMLNSEILEIIKLDEEKLEENKQGEVLTKNAQTCWESIYPNKSILDDGIMCECETSISKPVQNGFNEKGEEIFRKKVEARLEFYFEETGEHLCGLFLAFYFTYDNENAWIEDDNLMKAQTFAQNKYYKVSVNEEVCVAPGQCVVSLFSHLNNRETLLKNLERTEELHADIICLANGEVFFRNVLMGQKENLNKDGLKFTDLEVKSERVRHNLVRELKETKIEQLRDLENAENDVYRYIRRDLNLVYKDNKGNIVADVIIHAPFRYNIETHEVKCLSTYNTVQQGEVDVITRTGNETRSYGGAYGEIKLKYLTNKGTQKTFKDRLIIKCDSMGNVVSAFA